MVFSPLNYTSAPGSTGQPHEIRIVYRGDMLQVYLDAVQIFDLMTTSLPQGLVGFEVYRLDVTVDILTLTTIPGLIVASGVGLP